MGAKIPLDSLPSFFYTVSVSRQPAKKEVSIVRMTIYIPEDLHRTLRHISFDEGRSATEIVRELLKEYVAKKRKRKGVK